MEAIAAVDRMIAIAIRGCNHNTAARRKREEEAASVCAAIAAAVVAAAIVVIAAVIVVIAAVIVVLGGFFLSTLGIGVFLFFFGNLLRQILEHGLIGLVCLAQQVCIGDKLLQQLVGIGALGRERLLRAGKLSLLLLERDLLPCQLLLGGEDLRGDLAHVLEHTLVALSDLLDHGNAVEHFGERLCAEDDGPVRHVALLLHGADALLIAVEQVVLIGLELVKLRLLFGDEQIVLTDLLIQILDLLPRQLDLLIDLRLLLHDIERLGVVCGDLCLELLLLLVKLILLRFQAADLRADIRGIGREDRNKQTCQDRSGQQQRDDGDDDSSVLIHSIPSCARISDLQEFPDGHQAAHNADQQTRDHAHQRDWQSDRAERDDVEEAELT